jgi:hypothetical protein
MQGPRHGGAPASSVDFTHVESGEDDLAVPTDLPRVAVQPMVAVDPLVRS